MSFNLDDYEPVAARIARFYADHPNGAIHSEIIFDDGIRVVIKATVWRDITDCQPAGVDYAEEQLTDRGVNSTSRIENCSTSAHGRALAAIGYAPSDWTKKASREEMAKVQRMSGGAAPQGGGQPAGAQPASPAQIGKIRALLKEKGHTQGYVTKMFPNVVKLDDLDKRQASSVIERLLVEAPDTEEPF